MVIRGGGRVSKMNQQKIFYFCMGFILIGTLINISTVYLFGLRIFNIIVAAIICCSILVQWRLK